ncbi:hypothetical protein [Stella sp.]|uniref:hypothetical protein n=1 Tax=Stella sp. TaxID=2912054 RepID=UPI0035B35D69
MIPGSLQAGDGDLARGIEAARAWLRRCRRRPIARRTFRAAAAMTMVWLPLLYLWLA